MHSPFDAFSRRDFIKTGGALSLAAFFNTATAAPKAKLNATKDAPNLLFLNLDQLSHMALSCHGNPYLNTPNIDRLAARSVDFSKSYKNEIPLVVYAGNIGAGQGLHSIIPKVATLFLGKARFRIVGSGAQESLLSSAIKTKNLDNVEVLSPVSRDDLFDHYRAADVLFLHLNSYKSFHNVLPSKIFEYGSIGKPILAGVSGYAAAFMKKHLPDAQIFNPCDENGMKEALLRIIGDSVMIDRSKFHANFRRKNISNMVAREIVSLSNKQA